MDTALSQRSARSPCLPVRPCVCVWRGVLPGKLHPVGLQTTSLSLRSPGGDIGAGGRQSRREPCPFSRVNMSFSLRRPSGQLGKCVGGFKELSLGSPCRRDRRCPCLAAAPDPPVPAGPARGGGHRWGSPGGHLGSLQPVLSDFSGAAWPPVPPPLLGPGPSVWGLSPRSLCCGACTVSDPWLGLPAHPVPGPLWGQRSCFRRKLSYSFLKWRGSCFSP